MAETKPLTGIHLYLSAIALSLATFLIVLDYSIANVSIPYIAGDIGVSFSEGTYVITSFAVGNAIVLPLSGWLAKRFGLVRLVVFSLLGFILFSWVCGISNSLTMLVIARFIQGAVAGPLVPCSQSLTVSIFPKAKKNAALAFWSTVVVVAPVVGPILGGWISYDYSWPWIFFINIPVGLIAAFIIRLNLKSFETKKTRPPSDWTGLILLAIGVSALQFLLDKGEQFDWLHSSIIRTCASLSIVCLVFLIFWEITKKNPLLQLSLFKIRSFTLSVIMIGTIYALYFGGVVLVPLWLQEYMGYTPIWAGIAVAPLGIMPALFSWMTEKVTRKIQNLPTLAIACALFSLSSFLGGYFTTNVDIWHVIFTRFLFGFGILFFVVPTFALCIRDVPQEQYPQATGIFHFVRALSGAIGTSLITTLWIRRSAFHHANLVATLRPPDLDGLHFSTTQSHTFVNDLATEQAAMLGFNDCFYFMGWIFISLIAIIAVAIATRKRHA